MNRALDIYFNTEFMGKLLQNRSGDLSFTYSEKYLNENAIPVSVSMPLRKLPYNGASVKAFFSGLLPDERVRLKLARILGISDKNSFSLLEAVGGECAGALSLYPEGTHPSPSSSQDIELLDDKKLKEILQLLKRRPLLAGEDGLRLSLAGAQNKLAVGLKNRKITLNKNNSPTTHILKPIIDDFEDSVHNEFFCMRLAKKIEIEAPFVEIFWVGDTPCYIMARYDRVQTSTGVKRLHQEDFCQAIGIMPEIKYEREGGPSLEKCLNLLLEHSAQPAADQKKLFERVIFNYLIGNADAHAKNFSFLYKKTKPELAPAYDLLCTEIYPDLSKKMAMKIGGKYNPLEVQLRHWHRIIPDVSTAKQTLEKELKTFSETLADQAQSLKDDLKTKNIESPVFEKIIKTIQKRSTHLLKFL